MEAVGASEEFGRGFEGGMRRDEAAEGGGRTTPFPGLGGGAAGLLKVGGLRRGGLPDLLDCRGGGGGGIGTGVIFVVSTTVSASVVSDVFSSTLSSKFSMQGVMIAI